MSDVLKVENLKEGVSILTLNRPEVLNSLNKELIDSLLEAFNEILKIVQLDQSLLLERVEVFVVELT